MDAARRSRKARADGSGRYCGSGASPVNTRSSRVQNCTKTVSIAGSWRNTSARRAPETGCVSPSVRTTTSRLREPRSEVALGANRRERVERRVAASRGSTSAVGARCRPSDRASPRRRPRRLSGKRCGSIRSVSEAMPTGTSESDERSTDATFARAMRVGDPVSRRASIERETSTTTKTSASVRVRSVVDRSSTGWAAAAPRRAPAASTAREHDRDPAEGGRQTECASHTLGPAISRGRARRRGRARPSRGGHRGA